ncbi:MAG: SDR family oxidoreductase [Ignavibacteriaceae bacterium]|jgi:short-subunit dehydrogenase|nr:SDR family oxidoreductase [Ignavibacteriaceae bacterium]MCW8814204.1 SDR family oxidoreductase [Chlorobium sp.]MCW8817068.1 SDR family oxidoreductase [Ignavibacteriaceae bacterium]MCW8962142.1 SDR family oxidoreductase [Ignavibacteriaceae bacterium]MCW9094651.1 SDR family oxidoreductase [Ignavibacteriaceae bacterium]
MAKKDGIWITGASSGIGKAIALEFAKIGCNVFVSARRAQELERLKDEAGKPGDNIYTFPCNVASSTNVDQTFKKINNDFEVHCLINSAGITSFKHAADNSANEINDIINTNLLGAIYSTKTVLPTFIKNESGTIFNILSVVVNKTFTRSSVYAASKMGLLGYSNSLREEVRKHNIRVINIIPGATETSMWAQEIRKEKGERMMNPESLARIIVSAYLQKDNLVTEEIVLRPVTGDLD